MMYEYNEDNARQYEDDAHSFCEGASSALHAALMQIDYIHHLVHRVNGILGSPNKIDKLMHEAQEAIRKADRAVLEARDHVYHVGGN